MPNRPPSDWPPISSAVFYDDPAAAIEWLEKAFGFETRMRVEDGEGHIVHSELIFDGGLVMVAGSRPGQRSPRALSGDNTQSLFVFVEDVDAHFRQARAAGAHILTEPTDTDYGEYTNRGYSARDAEGHQWWFAERVRSGPA